MLLLFRPANALNSVDATGYYAWIRSAVIDGDLDTRNDFLERVKGQICGRHPKHPDRCDYRDNPYGIGTALFLSPFFLLAHFLAPLFGAGRDGFSLPYLILCGVGSSLYGLFGLLLTWRIAKAFYEERLATLATVTVWLASPLLFYMFPNNLYSHTIDVFVNALFLYVYVRTRGTSAGRIWLLYGLLIGLAMLVRLPNVYLGVVPLVDSGVKLWRREGNIDKELARYLLLAVGVVLALLPQMVVWKITRGAWLLTNPYTGATYDRVRILRPTALRILFSSDRGLLVWSPTFLLALAALPFFAKRDGRLAAALGLLFLLHFHLVASWSGVFGFGPRLLLQTVPIAILGLTALLSEAQRRVRLTTLCVIASGCMVWNFLLMGQYVLQLVPRNGPVNVSMMVRNQFTLIPNHIGRLLGAVAGRRE
jgi:hypothetical protein